MEEPRDDSEEHILHCGKVITNEVWGTVARRAEHRCLKFWKLMYKPYLTP